MNIFLIIVIKQFVISYNSIWGSANENEQLLLLQILVFWQQDFDVKHYYKNKIHTESARFLDQKVCIEKHTFHQQQSAILKLEYDSFQVSTDHTLAIQSKGNFSLRVGPSHCKSAPFIVWRQQVFCKWRYNVFDLPRDFTKPPY